MARGQLVDLVGGEVGVAGAEIEPEFHGRVHKLLPLCPNCAPRGWIVQVRRAPRRLGF